MKKIIKKICFELKMLYIDWKWDMKMFHCWEPYPPSFYYRYTPEERTQIWEKEKQKLLEMIAQLKD